MAAPAILNSLVLDSFICSNPSNECLKCKFFGGNPSLIFRTREKATAKGPLDGAQSTSVSLKSIDEEGSVGTAATVEDLGSGSLSNDVVRGRGGLGALITTTAPFFFLQCLQKFFSTKQSSRYAVVWEDI